MASREGIYIYIYDRRGGREGRDQRISINDPISRVIRRDCVVFALFCYRAEYPCGYVRKQSSNSFQTRMEKKEKKKRRKKEDRILYLPVPTADNFGNTFNSHLFSGTGAARLIEFETRPCILRFLFFSCSSLTYLE